MSKETTPAEMLTEIDELINLVDETANETLWLSMFLMALGEYSTANEFLSRLQIELERTYVLLNKLANRK